MKTDLTKLMLAGAVSLGTAGLASAGSANFSIVGGSGHAGMDFTVTVEESSRSAYDFDFVISNMSTGDGASITGIYFESGWATNGLLNSKAYSLRSGDDIDFDETTVGNAATPDGILSWGGSVNSYETDGSDMSDGIDEGESARISVIGANSGVTLADIEAALGNSGFNIALRIQDMLANDANATAFGMTTLGDVSPAPTNGGDDQGEVSGAPTPTAAAAGLALLAIAGYRRRRDG